MLGMPSKEALTIPFASRAALAAASPKRKPAAAVADQRCVRPRLPSRAASRALLTGSRSGLPSEYAAAALRVIP